MADELWEKIQQRRGIANACLYVCTWGKKREREAEEGKDGVARKVSESVI